MFPAPDFDNVISFSLRWKQRATSTALAATDVWCTLCAICEIEQCPIVWEQVTSQGRWVTPDGDAVPDGLEAAIALGVNREDYTGRVVPELGYAISLRGLVRAEILCAVRFHFGATSQWVGNAVTCDIKISRSRSSTWQSRARVLQFVSTLVQVWHPDNLTLGSAALSAAIRSVPRDIPPGWLMYFAGASETDLPGRVQAVRLNDGASFDVLGEVTEFGEAEMFRRAADLWDQLHKLGLVARRVVPMFPE